MKTELATKWNRLDKDDKLEIIQEAIDGWSVSDGSLFLRLFRDGSIVGYIQDEPDNHLTVEAVSVSTLGILFGDNHSYSVGDEQAILDWMESQS